MENLEGELTAKLVGVEQIEGLECARVSVQGTVTFDFKANEEDAGAGGVTARGPERAVWTVE